MTDVFDEKTRSNIMSKIRSKNTRAEILLRKGLWAKKLRGYRVHPKMLGNPDVVYSSKKIVIFVDGDFWHGYNWKILGKIPPKGYWQEKIERNIKRDEKYTKELLEGGWRVLRFWEHEIYSELDKCIDDVHKALMGKTIY